jgi:hypothetical protein
MASDNNKQIFKAHGTALWCKIVEPDFKFSEVGEFSTKLIISPEEKERLEDILDPMLVAHFNEVCNSAKNPASAKKAITMNSPIKEELDENGDETGNYVMNFKKKAVITAKKSGKEYKQTVPAFIGKGTPLPATKQVGNGSDIVVAFEVAKKSDMDTPGYFMASTKQVGLSLQLVAVLVRKLKEFTGVSDASIFEGEEFGEEFGEEIESQEVAVECGAGDSSEDSDF